MTDKQIVPVDDLTGAVADWRTLDKDALLDIGDRLNDVHKRLQLVIGAWLYVYEDALAYGDIKLLADRWDRADSTLMNWKSVYKKTQNLPHAVDSLPFSKVSELARIPTENQEAWLPAVTEMKRADLRAAVSAAKKTDDWTPPAGEIVVLEPAPASPKPSSEKQPEYTHVFSRLYWRKRD